MDLSVSTSLNDSLAALRQARPFRVPSSYSNSAEKTENLSPTLPAVTPQAAKYGADATRLASETNVQTESGYRKTSVFEKTDGRQFTRIEDFSLTGQGGAKRTVIQQNPSGSVTRYEEVLDRESGGTFRRTQRFQDGNGEVSTRITTNHRITDPFILTNGAMHDSSASPSSPFESFRGTQLDLQI